jgi:hypothetical protein
MVKLQRRPFGQPDDVREIPYGQLETYDMGEIRIGRSVLQPGWHWRESIQPIARTELCLEVRAAVHTGEIELEGGNVRGAAMHIAARDALALAKLRASGNFPARKPATRPHFCEGT